MSQLPAVPFGMRISPELEEYLTAFRREIEAELDARPELQRGVLIVTPDKPLQVWKDGVFYTLGEDVIPPMLGASDRASQGGNLAETDNDNTFTGNNTFTGYNTFTRPLRLTQRLGGALELRRLSDPSGDLDRVLDIDSVDVNNGRIVVRVARHSVIPNDVHFQLYNGDASSAIWFAARRESGVRVGNPTGGFRGAGTINAEAVYDDGTLLTDYVFDAALDGQIDIAAYDEATPDRVARCEDTGKELKREPRTHGPARAFRKCMDELDPAAFEAKWRESRKLPAVARCPEKPSLGQLAQALLETCEVQAVHIAKLEARLRALEERA